MPEEAEQRSSSRDSSLGSLFYKKENGLKTPTGSDILTNESAKRLSSHLIQNVHAFIRDAKPHIKLTYNGTDTES